jgi:hypothetical protein
MRRENHFQWWASVLVPLSVLSLTRCTTGGLDALGGGASDGGHDAGAALPEIRDGGPDASSGDARNGFTDGNVPDATDGAPSTDGTDGGEDVGDGGTSLAPASAPPIYLDAGTSSWCDTHPIYSFCDDFDKKPLPSQFSASDGPYLFQTSSSPSSAPNDLLLYVPAQTGVSTWGSKLSEPFTTPASSAVLEFDINPGSINAGSSGLLFAAMDFTFNANAKYSLRLAYNAGSPRLEESYLAGGNDIYHANFSLAAETWSRIQVAIAFSASGDAGVDAGRPLSGTETISVNGAQVQTQTLSPPASFDQRPTLLLGAVYGTNPTTGWVLRFDNVTFDIH